MIFLVIICILVDFVNFLDRLPLLNRGRRGVPNIRIFEYFIILVILTTLLVSIRTKSSIGRSKIVIVGNSEAIIILIDWVIVKRWLFFLCFDEWASIKSNSTKHGLDILNTTFLLYDLSLENPPIFHRLLGDIIQNDLLLDGVNYFFVLFDWLVIFTQISEISCIFEILFYLLQFALHWDIWVIIYYNYWNKSQTW